MWWSMIGGEEVLTSLTAGFFEGQPNQGPDICHRSVGLCAPRGYVREKWSLHGLAWRKVFLLVGDFDRTKNRA